jgi:hypothetical protein
MKILFIPERDIKWMCFDVFFTTNKIVLDLDFKPLSERLNGGSYGYTVNGQFRTKKWINEHCVNVLGFIFND